jgi:peptide/nickel transport system substrate-binding protein
MGIVRRLTMLAFVVLIGVVACAPPPPPGAGSSASGSSATGARAEKRIVYAIPLATDFRPAAERGSRQAVLPLLMSGLSTSDAQGGRRPLIAEEVPTLENGRWQVNPDGTMVTTYPIRASAHWHDGTPITAEDFAFTLDVSRDRSIPAMGIPAYRSILDVATPDPRTLVVHWTEPYVEADTLFSWDKGYGPLPRHVLADAYSTNKDGFFDLPYWTQEFVGTGPFKLVSWDPGSGLQLVAHDSYALGRPKIDRIDVQIISDHNTVIANLLAGTIDVFPNLQSVDSAQQLRGQWRGGTALINASSTTWTVLVPQLLDPNPAVISNLPFRRALAHGVNRQAIVEEILAGFSPVPVSFLNPGPQYASIEATLPRYDYDLAAAAQGLLDLGYTRGADGSFRDGSGQPISIEVRSGPSGGEQQARVAAVIADDWVRLGLQSFPARTPPQQANNNAYRATFPAYWVKTGITDPDGLRGYTTVATPLPSNDFAVGAPRNDSRYMNEELDSLVTRYFRTIPVNERVDILGRIANITVRQLIHLGVFYDASTAAHSGRLTGVSDRWVGPNFPWQAYEWDVRG